MKLSTDKIIQIVLVIIIVVLACFLLIKDKNGLPSGSDVFTLTNEETNTPVTKTYTPPKATTPTPKPTPAVTTASNGCRPGLSGKKSSDLRAILLNWSTCSNEDFQFYKVVKSALNTNPTYPGSTVVLSSPNRSVTNFVDKAVAAGNTYYYRVCVVQRLNNNTCGNSIAVKY